jgi:hypothetical protein
MSDLSSLPLDQLCRLGGSLAFSVDNALTLSIIRRHGHEAAESIQFNVLRSHQKDFFLPGLKKLGLDEEATDAVRCAKYHFLSNALGGLRVTYAEEGPDKAWIVYETPYWVDSPWHPSIAVASFRPEMLIETMRAWHANNGAMLGNPGLAFVMTEMVTAGGARDAGYFIETHRALEPDERLQVRLDEGVPPGLDLRGPAFDPAVWPLERQAKAWRNFSVAYVGGRLYWMLDALGEEETAEIFAHALRLTILQHREHIHDLLAPMTETGAARGAALWAAWHSAWGDEVEIAGGPKRSVTGTVRRSRLHEVGEFAPPAHPLPDALERAAAAAWATVVAYDCPGTTAVAEGSATGPSRPWRFVFA